MDKQQWSTIIQLQQYLKKIMLIAEELEFNDFKVFLQPTLEQRSALDHICRAMSVEADVIEAPDAAYASGNFDKAIGHLYRAFFDAADWLSIIIRDRFLETLDPYDNESITAVCPEYYEILRPELEQVSIDIATSRNDKDIAMKKGSLVADIDEYVKTLNRLRETYNQLLTKVPVIHEYASKKNRETGGKRLWDIVKVAISAAIGFFFGKL